MHPALSWIRRPIRAVRRDLRSDPYLRWILLLGLVTCGFGVWFRVPNFAGPDEYSRLIQPMKVAGQVAADPSVESLRAGVLDGRALGATFYLYALALAPMFLVVVATGRIGEFAQLGTLTSRWDLWHAAPSWFWTGSILFGRLVNVLIGVGCVYLTYRLGTRLVDRRAGLLSAGLLSLSPGFFTQAHLVGEDVPMLFFLLLTVLYAAEFVKTGSRPKFFVGCAVGGLAIAFKLTGGVSAIVLGLALVERARRSQDLRETLGDPQLVLGGCAIGLTAIAVGMPSVLVGGPTELIARMTNQMGTKTARSGGLNAPIWYWIVYQYVSGLGIPLLIAVCLGVVAALIPFAEDEGSVAPLRIILLGALVAYLVVYSRWNFLRIHHLLPTYPALLVLSAGAVVRCYSRPRLRFSLRISLAVLLLLTAAFAGAAEYQYVSEPRDQATAWYSENAASNETIEVYENSIADVSVPHGQPTSHYHFPENNATNDPSLVLNESSFTKWMLATEERKPEYVELTDREFRYLDPRSPASEQFPERREHVRSLLDNETEYEVVATFGTRPSFQDRSLGERLVRAGVRPNVSGHKQVIIVLRRSDDADT